MSYLLEKSTIISKKELYDNEEAYLTYEKYEVDGHYIISDNEKPFFSIYDIAYFCTKKYPEDKLFLIVHRYFDKVQNEKITEFYIINSADIFEKSVTSFLSVSNDELIDKQHIIQNNIDISMKLLGCESLHIILGDNIKFHEVIEYVFLEPTIVDSYEIFEENSFDEDFKYENNNEEHYLAKYDNVKNSKISTILNSVRIIEPKSSKVKKIGVLVSVVVIALVGSKDITDSFFEKSLYAGKKELRDEQRKLKNIRNDYDFKNNASFKLKEKVKVLNQQEVYIHKKDQK